MLKWFSQDPDSLQRYRTKPSDTCEAISKEIFRGIRSANAIDAQWDAMKSKYEEACVRLRGKGERERDLQELRDDEGKWEGIQTGWLRKFCPYFETIDKILTRDWFYLAAHAPEDGEEYLLRSGQRVCSEEVVDDSGNGPDAGGYPPTGGGELPTGRVTGVGPLGSLKRGAETGSGQGERAVKMVRVDACIVQHEARMQLEKEMFDYEKKRDERWVKFLEKKEDNRHNEAMQHLRLLQLRVQKDMGMDVNEGLYM